MFLDKKCSILDSLDSAVGTLSGFEGMIHRWPMIPAPAAPKLAQEERNDKDQVTTHQ